MSARVRKLLGCPAPVAPLPPQVSPRSATFSMARSATFSMAIDTPAGPCPTGSPRRQGHAGLAGRFSGHSPWIGMRGTWWPPDANLRPRCPLAMPVPSWPGTGRSPGSTGKNDHLAADTAHVRVDGLIGSQRRM